MNENFYMLYTEEGELLKNKYLTYNGAVTESERLAQLTGKKVWIMAPVIQIQMIENQPVISTPYAVRMANYIRDRYSYQKIGDIEWPGKRSNARRMYATREVKRLINENPELFRKSK